MLPTLARQALYNLSHSASSILSLRKGYFPVFHSLCIPLDLGMTLIEGDMQKGMEIYLKPLKGDPRMGCYAVGLLRWLIIIRHLYVLFPPQAVGVKEEISKGTDDMSLQHRVSFQKPSCFLSSLASCPLVKRVVEVG
jgi:hypothetical protein